MSGTGPRAAEASRPADHGTLPAMSGFPWATRADVPDAWFLVDEAGIAIRKVARHENIGSAVRFTVTGPGYDATDHSSLDDAKAAAEDSLGY